MTQPIGGPQGAGSSQPPPPPGQAAPPPSWSPPPTQPPAWSGGSTGPAAPGGWAAGPTERRSSGRRKWLIGCSLLLLLLVVGVGACTFWFARSFGAAATVVAASNGRIDGVNVNTTNGGTRITFQAAKGVDATEGTTLACTVVRPNLAGSDLATADWVIVDRAGDVIASKATPCP